ncbi:MAG: hypothetical protein WD401_00745 [Thermomicrobiaceae bacterium]
MQEITDLLRPYVAPIVRMINVDEFTTVEFIEAMQLDPETKEAYDLAIRRWIEPGDFRAKTVIHGQVIPILLRETGLVSWEGYAHGERDEYAVPAWWRKLEPSGDADVQEIDDFD